MTDEGRTSILDAVKSLDPGGNTNLWDGLKVGMDLLTGVIAPNNVDKPAPEKRKSPFGSLFRGSKKDAPVTTNPIPTQPQPSSTTTSGRFSTLFILTDGMPNVNPPRGHIPMLKAYLDKLDNRNPFSISTFGFGYSLDTKLLLEIAQVGGGGYGFIPDSGIVGTVFVHAVANAFSTYAPRARLDVEVPEGTTVKVKGGLPVTQTSWGVQIAVGDVQFGQSLDVVLECSPMITNDIAATLTYRPVTGEERKTEVTLKQSVNDLAAVRYHAARLEFVETLNVVDNKAPVRSVKKLEELAAKITGSPVLGKHADALALAKDISGEGVLALESANYNKWGRHYLPSLARSHLRQQCANFKDPGLQVYGRESKVFVQERDKLDAAFMALPPPEPSIPQFAIYNTSGGHAAPAPRKVLTSMSSYYNSSGPCFAGDCVVEVVGGDKVRVEELRRGMQVKTLNGTGVVDAVVRTSVRGGVLEMCRVGDLRVTPWHPIVVPESGKWVFPADVVKPETVVCDAIYSVLLMPGDVDGHSVMVGGVWCVTLGHGLTTVPGDVRVHGFLGDYRAVATNLARMKGYHGELGVVDCAGLDRDEKGLICGFIGDRGEAKVIGCGQETRVELAVAQVVY